MTEQMQLELNKALFDAAKNYEWDKIDDLLTQGADPLGSAEKTHPEEHILGELIYQAADDEALAAKMPQLVQTFFNHGMDIAAKKIPFDDGDNINPLWNLCFCCDEFGLLILKAFLDNRVDVQSVEVLIDHIFTDMKYIDDYDAEDAELLERWSYWIKMVMLAASYPYVIDNSEYIRRCVESETNEKLFLPYFREYNSFSYHFFLKTIDSRSHVALTIKEEQTGNDIWTMQI